MGAVHSSLDPELLSALASAVPIEMLIQTGAAPGDPIDSFTGLVSCVIAIEPDPVRAATSSKRFAGDDNVRVIHGEPVPHLERLAEQVRGDSVVFWLADLGRGRALSTSPEETARRCQALEELAAIGPLNESSFVLIDDAWRFLGPAHAQPDQSYWPSFADILVAASSMSGTHGVAVVNDVIVIHPGHCSGVVADFAAAHGVNWQEIADRSRAYDSVVADNRAKAEEIRAKTAALDALRASAAMEADSGSSTRRRRDVRSLPVTAQRWARSAAARSLVHPFTLRQYPPRPMMHVRSTAPTPSGALPSIAVAMPSFNQVGFAADAVASVLAQRYPGLEFVIQDGGSTDGSVAVLTSYRDRVDRLTVEPDAGQADAINKAFRHTSADIMGWLNSDDLLLPGALQTIGAYFAAHPEVDVVYGWRRVIDDAGLEVGRWRVPASTHEYLDWADYVPQETLYWRRSLWDRVGGGLDTSFSFAIDWELLLRFVDAGARFARLPVYLGAFRVHDASKTVSQIAHQGADDMERLRRRRGGRVSTSDLNRALRPLYARAWISAAVGGRA